ncbi:MAG: septation protein A [Thiobacillus sp. SCN 63-1177]|nr:MAG: septation protein A [Thiobacillus sp. SCN 63-1177]
MKKLLFDLFPIIVFFIAYKLGDANADATRTLLAGLGLPQPTGVGEKPGIYLATLVAIVASVGQIVGAAAFGRNVIKSVMNEQMELPDVAWSRLNASWGGFFAFMGVANLFVAFNFSTDAWVDFKLFGSLGLMLVFVIGQSMMLTKYLDKADMNKEEKQ